MLKWLVPKRYSKINEPASSDADSPPRTHMVDDEPVKTVENLPKPYNPQRRALVFALSISALFLVTILSAVALFVYFAWFREPTLTQKSLESDTLDLSVISLRDTSFHYHAKAVYELKNPNYFELAINSIDIDIAHIPMSNGMLASSGGSIALGSIHHTKMVFEPRNAADFELNINLGGPLGDAAALLQDCYCLSKAQLRFEGTAEGEYLGQTAQLPLSFEETVDCEVSGPLKGIICGDFKFPDLPINLPDLPNILPDLPESEDIVDVVEDIIDGMPSGDQIEDAIDTANDAIEKANDAIDQANDAIDQANEAIDKANEQKNEAADQASDAVGDATGEDADAIKDEVDDQVGDIDIPEVPTIPEIPEIPIKDLPWKPW